MIWTVGHVQKLFCLEQVLNVESSYPRSTRKILSDITNKRIAKDNNFNSVTMDHMLQGADEVTKHQKVKLAQSLLDAFGGIFNL
jgi:hypothetical protein